MPYQSVLRIIVLKSICFPNKDYHKPLNYSNSVIRLCLICSYYFLVSFDFYIPTNIEHLSTNHE